MEPPLEKVMSRWWLAFEFKMAWLIRFRFHMAKVKFKEKHLKVWTILLFLVIKIHREPPCCLESWTVALSSIFSSFWGIFKLINALLSCCNQAQVNVCVKVHLLQYLCCVSATHRSSVFCSYYSRDDVFLWPYVAYLSYKIWTSLRVSEERSH